MNHHRRSSGHGHHHHAAEEHEHHGEHGRGADGHQHGGHCEYEPKAKASGPCASHDRHDEGHEGHHHGHKPEAAEKKGSCGHDGHHHDGDVTPSSSAKYFCPMCPGVEFDKPGDCPKCGMALERNPAWVGGGKTIYTCPMHPEVQQDHPGDCPKCGMPLEPASASVQDDDDEAELRKLARKLSISAALALPVFLSAMLGMMPGVSLDSVLSADVRRWLEFILATPVVFWAGDFIWRRSWN